MRSGPISITVDRRVRRRACARVAQGHPHARQQLVHAEGLRQVVVGAGVERRDLVVLAAAGRDHDDRHAAPLADPPRQIDAVAVGQAEVQQDQLGVVRRRRDQRLPDGLRLDDAVALRRRARCAGTAASAARPRRRGPAAPASLMAPALLRRLGRPTWRRRLLQRQRGSGRRRRRPSRFSAAIVPPWAWTMPRQMARPRPTPPPRARGPAVELLEHLLLRRPRGGPGRGRRPRSPAAAGRARAAISSGVPAAVYLTTFSRRLTKTCSKSTGSTEQRAAGPRAGPTRTRASPSLASSRDERRADDLLERHPLAPRRRCRRTRAAPCRGCCATSRSIRSASVQIVSQQLRALRPAPSRPRSSRSVVPAPVIAASGVRRSCDTALEQRAARLLGARAQRRGLGLLDEPRALDGERGLPDERLEEAAGARPPGTRRTAPRHASAPSVVAAGRRAGRRSRASPAACRCRARRAGRARWPSGRRRAPPRSARSAGAARGPRPPAARPVVGSSTTASPPKTSAACAAVDLARPAPRPGTVASSRLSE